MAFIHRKHWLKVERNINNEDHYRLCSEVTKRIAHKISTYTVAQIYIREE